MQQKFSKKEELILEALSEVIIQKRKEIKKSQRVAAFEFGLQKSMFSRFENIKNEPKLFSFWKVAEALEIKPSELMKLIEEKLGFDFKLTDD